MLTFAANRFSTAKTLMAQDNVPAGLDLMQSLLGIVTDVQERWQILSKIDFGLLHIGRDDEAQALWDFERAKPMPQENVLALLVASAMRARRHSVALQRLDSVSAILTGPKAQADRLGCQIARLETTKATALIGATTAMPDRIKERFRIQVLIADTRYKELLDLIPVTRKGKSVDLLRVRMRALAGCGYHDAVESEIASHKAFYPHQSWIGLVLAQNAASANWRELAVTRWADMVDKHGPDPSNLKNYFSALISNVELDRAAQVLNDSAGHYAPSVLAELHSKLHVVNGRLDQAEATLQEAIADAAGHAPQRAVAQLWSEKSALELRRFASSGHDVWLRAHLTSAQAAHDAAPEVFQPHVKLIDAMIRCGHTAQAMEKMDSLPENHRPESLRLAVWRHDAAGDVAAARKAWTLRRRIHYMPQIDNGPRANLTRLDNHELPPSDELALYTVVRNERKRLPWFLGYYRKLGLRHFVFVDNGSSDDSLAYLLQQPDVTLYSTQDSYVSGLAGMVWVNHLKNRISANGWALYVDVDEALVFDMSEQKTIHDLIAEMEACGDEAMTGFMLDMYADRDCSSPPMTDDTDYIARYPNFLNLHHENPAPVSPYRNIRGGARMVFGAGEELTKTPLVKVSAGINFLRSSHNITPARISGSGCALLHFKLIDGLQAEAEAVLKDVQRSSDCQVRYLRYLTEGNVHDLLDEFLHDCCVFKDSAGLVALGVIPRIAGFHGN